MNLLKYSDSIYDEMLICYKKQDLVCEKTKLLNKALNDKVKGLDQSRFLSIDPYSRPLQLYITERIIEDRKESAIFLIGLSGVTLINPGQYWREIDELKEILNKLLDEDLEDIMGKMQ